MFTKYLPILLLPLLLSGCSLFAGTLTPNEDVSTKITYQSLPENSTVEELRREQVVEPYILPNGEPLRDAAGNPVMVTRLVIERNLPSTPGQIRYGASSEFLNKEMAVSIGTSPEGAAINFGQTGKVAEGAYADGVTAQTLQQANAWTGAASIADKLSATALGYFAAWDRKNQLQTQTDLAKEQRRSLLGAIEAGALPPGFTLIPQEEESDAPPDTTGQTPAPGGTPAAPNAPGQASATPTGTN